MKTPRAIGAVTGGRTAQDVLFVLLDGGEHPAAHVGGKAAALDRLVAAGFRVPASAALTSDAYRRFVRTSGLDGWLARFARRRPGGADKADAERREVEAAFRDAPLPDEVRDAIAAAWEAVSDGHQVAVRSSATAEDMAASSFAGQYLSILEVEGLDDVEIAVKRVWASLWEAGARAYRRRMRIDNRGLAMGVVIQRMVPALRSGVCFTVDPTRDATVRIEVVDGLGEQLVSGSTTPTLHQLTKPALSPVAGDVDPELRRVARTALRIQEEMGNRPQDVEWSLADDGLWILQARPITTLNAVRRDQSGGDGFDTEPVDGGLFSPTGVGEMLPGVLPPLLWTINAPMVEDGFRKLFGELNALPDSLDSAYSILARINGQAALNISVIKESARKLSGGNGEEIERQYLGRVVTDDGGARVKKPGVVRRTTSSLRAMKLQRKVEARADAFERAVRSVAALDTPVDEMLTAELVAYRARLRDLAAGGVATEVALATIAVTTYAALEEMLDRWTGAGQEWAQRITRGASISGDPVTAAAARVWDQFQASPSAPQLIEAITGGEPGTVEDRLVAVGNAGSDFVTMLRAELERLGSSAVYAGPLWTEQRGYVWAVVMRWFSDPQATDDGRQVSETARRDLDELERTFMRTWGWRAKRILTGQVIDIRKRTLHQMIEDAQRLLHRRETVKSALLALGGIERRVIAELGERLARRGWFRTSRDVQLLADWELDDLALGLDEIDLETLKVRREALLAYTSGPTLTPLVSDTTRRDAATANRIDGWAASPGKHRGRARIMRDLSQAAELGTGDVLVASATDPSWTPLFMIAGAIVVERGGPLSHAAIVSRELGVPAVLNAPGATALADGTLVEVDGSTGTVTILDDDPFVEEAV
jgi:rifampicin phosphotransferase